MTKGWTRPATWLLVVVLLALVLRLWGIDFGLPYIYDTDEGFEVRRALKLGAGVFDFDRVGKGGYFYLLFVLYAIYYGILRVGGAISGSWDFLLAFFHDPTPFWLIGRYLTAAVGTANCIALYCLGRRTHSTTAGLFAASLMAVNLLHIRGSHVIGLDVPLTTVVTVGFLLMYWHPLDRPASVTRYGLIGVTMAVATATKLPGAVMLVPALLFHYNQGLVRGGSRVKGRFADRRLWILLVTGAVLYVALEPGIILRIGSVIGKLTSFFGGSTSTDVVVGSPVSGRYEHRASHYFGALFPLHQVVLAIPLFVGVIASLRRRPLREHLGVSFVVPYCFFLLSSRNPELVYARYVLPLTPVVWLYAGWGLAEIWAFLAARGRGMQVTVTVSVAAGCLAPMLVASALIDRALTWPDTRTLAKEWIEAQVPAGSVIYMAGSVVSASTMSAPLLMAPDLVDGLIADAAGSAPEGGTQKGTYYEAYKQYLAGQWTYQLVLTDNATQLRDALEEGVGDYVLENEGVRSFFASEYNREHFPYMWRLIQWTHSEAFALWKEFRPAQGLTGPTLLLYRRIR